MSINFPFNPSMGQTFTFIDVSWEYNGYAWEKLCCGTGLALNIVNTFNGQTGDVIGVNSVDGATGDVVINIIDGGKY